MYNGAFKHTVRGCVWVTFLIAAVALLAAEPPRKITMGTMDNVFDLGGDFLSGSAPETDADFAALATAGVKIIVSVDGSKPDVESAHRHGIRYVHLPIGYDGISQSRRIELAKFAETAAGRVFVHCHHGKHRGPAAAAVICEAKNHWSHEEAVAWLKQAGTAGEYAGLYKSVREFRMPDAAALAKVSDVFPESAQTPPMVDVMVAVDALHDQLQAAQKAGWREIPAHPDLAPKQAATLLWEHFRELGRAPDIARKPPAFRAKLLDAENASDAMRSAFVKDAPLERRDAAFRQITASCADCHKAHRN